MARRKGWRRFNTRSQHNSHTQPGNSPAAPIGEISAAGSVHVQTPETSGNAPAENHAPNGGGSGESHELAETNRRGDSGRSKIQESRMLQRAIDRGWIRRHEPWGLNRTAAELEQLRIAQGGLLTMQQRAEVAVMQDLNGNDGRLRQIAVKSVVTMRGQDLGDEHHADRMEFHERALAARTAGAARGGVGVAVNVGGGAGGAPGLDGVGAGGTMPGVTIFIPHNFRDEVPGLVDGLTIEGLEEGVGESLGVGDDKEFLELNQSLEC